MERKDRQSTHSTGNTSNLKPKQFDYTNLLGRCFSKSVQLLGKKKHSEKEKIRQK